MKKVLSIILSLIFVFSLSACGNKKDISEKSTVSDISAKSDKIDVDLTKLSSTMVYSQVNNMVTQPDAFLEKTVKMKGDFSIYKDDKTGKVYYSCIIADATACCSQGIEFVLKGNPDQSQYPKEGEEITVCGKFSTYEENRTLYCTLVDAQLVN